MSIVTKNESKSEWLEGFLASEDSHRDVISIKRIYIDMCGGNHYDAAILAQIIYWHGQNRETGKPRLKIERGGFLWLAKNHRDWWEECRVNENTAKKAIARLKKRGLIHTQLWKFNGSPTLHIRMAWNAFEAWIRYLRSNLGLDTKYLMDSVSNIQSLTETTKRDYSSEITQGDKGYSANASHPAHSLEKNQSNQSNQQEVESHSGCQTNKEELVNELSKNKEVPRNSPSKEKPRLRYKDGWLQFPKSGKHKLPGALALRTVQWEILLGYAGEGFEWRRDGDRYLIYEPQMMEWYEEDEFFCSYHPLQKMIDLRNEGAFEWFAGHWFNERALYWLKFWQYNCDRMDGQVLCSKSVAHWVKEWLFVEEDEDEAA